jgi:hypothetical protein
LNATAIKSERASRVKRAACGDGQRRGQLPGQGHILVAPPRPHLRDGTQKRLCVRMQRRCEHCIGIADLHDASKVHHRNPVREVAHDAKIMLHE